MLTDSSERSARNTSRKAFANLGETNAFGPAPACPASKDFLATSFLESLGFAALNACLITVLLHKGRLEEPIIDVGTPNGGCTCNLVENPIIC